VTKARTKTDYSFTRVTTRRFAALVESDERVVVLVPVGSVEPHGPHLTLLADTFISEAAATRGAARLAHQGVHPFVAPAVPYGVTDCATEFAGAVSVSAAALTAYVRSLVKGFLDAGAAHVCLVNNHLEPAHDAAVRAAVQDLSDEGKASVACPLTTRWARTLSDEFKSGQCHAGRYETSIVLAAVPAGVDDAARADLPPVAISMSDKLRSGVTDFMDMGLEQAYAGDPAAATAEEGERLIDLLADMVETEVFEALDRAGRLG